MDRSISNRPILTPVQRSSTRPILRSVYSTPSVMILTYLPLPKTPSVSEDDEESKSSGSCEEHRAYEDIG